MIDFHAHIIPKLDDGSRDIDMTMEMLAEEYDQGISTVVATPHFYAHQKSIYQFLVKREKRLKEMHSAIERTGLSVPDILAGTEVHFFQDMGQAENLAELCIQGSDVILIEMPFAQWTDNIYHDIRRIITNRGLKVVLAHIERYPQFQKNKEIWDKIMELPLVTQLNAGSFQKGWRKRKFCIDWISSGHQSAPPSVLGSDCHDLTARPPNIRAAREIITRKAGAAVLEKMNDTASELLGI